MPKKLLLWHARVCVNTDGAPRQTYVMEREMLLLCEAEVMQDPRKGCHLRVSAEQ